MTTLRLRAMREDRGRFAALRDERVFVYWPHGLGDFAYLGVLLPLLEPSNRYALARFGDEYCALLDPNPHAEVLTSGTRAPSDGSEFGCAHFGLDLRRLDGREREIAVPEPLGEHLAAFGPTAMLWTDYPETEGRTAFPFHTKARNLARALVARERLATFDLTTRLPAAVDFGVCAELQRLVDERLRTFAPPGAHIYVLSTAGYTAPRKSWEPAQARAFVDLLRRRDARARIVTMEEPSLRDPSQWPGREIVAGYRELFDGLDAAFARVYLALLNRAAGVVAVPAGPLHVAMVRGDIPIVGIWVTHLPEWYDEPNPLAVHVIGDAIRERGFDRRPATKTLPKGWHRKIVVGTKSIGADAVIEALT
ncbi:MAG: hypothetical protein ACREMP_06395 [Candidatus Tyrphobacter sp.]